MRMRLIVVALLAAGAQAQSRAPRPAPGAKAAAESVAPAKDPVATLAASQFFELHAYALRRLAERPGRLAEAQLKRLRGELYPRMTESSTWFPSLPVSGSMGSGSAGPALATRLRLTGLDFLVETLPAIDASIERLVKEAYARAPAAIPCEAAYMDVAAPLYRALTALVKAGAAADVRNALELAALHAGGFADLKLFLDLLAQALDAGKLPAAEAALFASRAISIATAPSRGVTAMLKQFNPMTASASLLGRNEETRAMAAAPIGALRKWTGEIVSAAPCAAFVAAPAAGPSAEQIEIAARRAVVEAFNGLAVKFGQPPIAAEELTELERKRPAATARAAAKPALDLLDAQMRGVLEAERQGNYPEFKKALDAALLAWRKLERHPDTPAAAFFDAKAGYLSGLLMSVRDVASRETLGGELILFLSHHPMKQTAGAVWLAYAISLVDTATGANRLMPQAAPLTGLLEPLRKAQDPSLAFLTMLETQ